MNVDAGVKLHLFPHSHKSLEGIYTAYGECFAMNHIRTILMYDALYTHVRTSVTDHVA
jgi:hypothetical protein